MPFVQIWIPTIDLDQFDKDVIMNGGLLCDKHMNGASKLISQQFPAVHGMQNTLLSQIWVVMYPSWTIVSCMLLSIILPCLAQLKPTLDLYTPLNAEYSKYLGLKCISCM